MARTTRRRAPAATTPTAGDSPAEAPRRVRENLPRPTATGGSSGSGGGRPVAAGASGTGGGSLRPTLTKSRNPFGFLGKIQPRFVSDIVSELRKVTWPTFNETRYLTIVVAIVSLVVGIFLGTIDFIFGWTVERLFF